MKGVMKHLLMTMPRYQDNKSRRAVEQVIETMAQTHSDKFQKIFVVAMADMAEAQKKIVPW